MPRSRRSVADPSNLLRVMPAEGGTLSAALVFAGGDAPRPEVARQLAADALVVAADSGLEHAQQLERAVDLVVGDLDSVTSDALDRAVAAGAEVERHPTDKDATDLDLALQHCVRVRCRAGDRRRRARRAPRPPRGEPAAARRHRGFEALEVDAWMGDAHLLVVRGTRRVTGPLGSLCTLLAAGRPARRRDDRGPALPAARRRARARLDARGQQRARRARSPRSR